MEVKPICYFPKLIVGLFLILLLLPTPTWAVPPTIERVPLTIELLQERIRSPIQSEGVRWIDLHQLMINLRPENTEFRDQFYLLLQTQLNRSETPLGLDFSNSIIQGELIGSKLGLRTPLYGDALSPRLTSEEQQQLLRDSGRFSELIPIPTVTVFRGAIKLTQAKMGGTVDFANTFFLNRVEMNGAIFTQESDWSDTRWTRRADFSDTTFSRNVNFSGSYFFAKAGFSRTQFRGVANFRGSTFAGNAVFNQAQFVQLADFTRSRFLKIADLTQTRWRDRTLFSKSCFLKSLLLPESIFEKAVAFREAQFHQSVNLRGVSLLEQVDFSNARFIGTTYINVAGLTFDSDQAKILGDTGRIGRVLSVPVLAGNESVLRNLVRNFRSLQQIADANQIEYTTQRLRQKQLGKFLFKSQKSAQSGKDRVEEYSEALSSISSEHSPTPLSWFLETLTWVGLSLLLLLSRYGTSFWLVFGVGLVAIAYFGLLFWLVDRFRRRHPQPIVPTVLETPWMFGSYGVLTFGGVMAIFRAGDRPWLTLVCLGGVILPMPMLLLWRLYRQGRYHNLMEVSYFVEDGSLRQLHLLIGRLPIMPRFEMFRDRYMPILWDRRWNWLNYYDFSLNNLLKLGFNDIRLRDEHLPGIISTLVWYQWSLGILYIALLFWTLSRTIPGLNLLIYLK
jgi:uncharacterized protein YjbI with pentapeptide repeats